MNEDKVICGYHGLTFDGSGSCVAAPTQQKNIPKRAVVKSYPVIDRYRLLWIWMGDPDKADPNDIFNIEYMDSIVGAGFKVWDAFFSAQWNRGISWNNKETAQRF